MGLDRRIKGRVSRVSLKHEAFKKHQNATLVVCREETAACRTRSIFLGVPKEDKDEEEEEDMAGTYSPCTYRERFV
jgi:hypothetical protein